MPKGERDTQCTKCGETKSNSKFRFFKRSLYCRKCESTRDKKYKRLRKPITQRAFHLRTKYGLNEESLAKLIQSQRGECKICKRKFTQSGETRACVDHCHNASHVRGILCRRCNRAEGIIGTASNALALYQYMFENELFEAKGPEPTIE